MVHRRRDEHSFLMNSDKDRSAKDGRETPWVSLRSVGYQTFIYSRMVGDTSADARPGDVVTVYDRRGDVFGHGIYNPCSMIALRMLNFDATPVDDAFWQTTIERAVALRCDVLRLDGVSDAYRLVHAEGDGVSGLIVDRYRDTLSIEVFSFGIWRMIERLIPMLHEAAGTKHHRVHVDDRVLKQEKFDAKPIASEEAPKSLKLTEHGVRFRVDFALGHKTGFFCDQRENRLRLSRMTCGASVLDLCCYSGGFGLYAKVLGDAADVTCVDLDENMIEVARGNANLNQVKINAVHSDAFTYMRQMQTNKRLYDVVVLDPPKLIFSKTDQGEGRAKYNDLNRLAATLVKPGGVLLTCSCSGAFQRDEFLQLATSAASRDGRACQVLDVSGAGPDHPVSTRCRESEYLKAVWLRLS